MLKHCKYEESAKGTQSCLQSLWNDFWFDAPLDSSFQIIPSLLNLVKYLKCNEGWWKVYNKLNIIL